MPPVVVLWFKRDLRLSDHPPLAAAVQSGYPVLLAYWFEPSATAASPVETRHFRFIWESLQDLQAQLQPYAAPVHIFHGEVLPTLEALRGQVEIKGLFSHEETGNRVTYDRDKAVKRWSKQHGIPWREFQTGGVQRGRKNRDGWADAWHQQMRAPTAGVDLNELGTRAYTLPAAAYTALQGPPLPAAWQTPNAHHQPGGRSYAVKYLESFFQTRHQRYNWDISKPGPARRAGSRLSPYLTWGNVSLREVFQRYEARRQAGPPSVNRSALDAFGRRLRWHCHFIQKFEMEDRMEFENVNRGFDGIRAEVNEAFVTAWKTGQTGFPMVDASMRSVLATGFLNFRMRAMLVSFLTHHLWQDWRLGSAHLGAAFLDYEPGIHYGQFQMQAGVTGINIVRIYNPTKQAVEHDPDGEFIRKWVPELRDLPTPAVHNPGILTALEQKALGFELGKAYPAPIVDLKQTYARANRVLWGLKKDPLVQQEAARILETHTVAERDRFVQTGHSR